MEIHGASTHASRHHPVLDLARWTREFPLGESNLYVGNINSPRDLALTEQARAAASRHGLGPSVSVDCFVWAESLGNEKPWLTRIGGRPWRSKAKPWPKHSDGVPLQFLGQICFADSGDLLPFELPGDVALVFGRWGGGYVAGDGIRLEWSSLKISNPEDGMEVPWSGELAFCYQGVIHRTVQYTSEEKFDAAFQAVGWDEYAGPGALQATQIGAHANLPQGWPFEVDDGNTLVAVLSSFSFYGDWPLCNVRRSLQYTRADGSEFETTMNALNLGIGDSGAIWIYRDAGGEFQVGSACM